MGGESTRWRKADGGGVLLEVFCICTHIWLVFRVSHIKFTCYGSSLLASIIILIVFLDQITASVAVVLCVGGGCYKVVITSYASLILCNASRNSNILKMIAIGNSSSFLCGHTFAHEHRKLIATESLVH